MSARRKARMATSIAGLAAMLWFAPSPLRGQDAGMDAWRASLGERLDETIDNLRLEAPQPKAPAMFVVQPRANETGEAPAISPDLSKAASGNRFPMLAGILRAHGLPPSLLGVAAVESGFNPAALSPKGARGLWQLMPETARRYGLAVEPGRDERLDPVKSTHAAARYMNDLYAQFQDWPLALAAYNAGENRVERALERRGAGDFWTLSRLAALPEETRRYVPAVLEKSILPSSVASLAPLGPPPPALSPSAALLPEARRAIVGRVIYATPSQGAFGKVN